LIDVADTIRLSFRFYLYLLTGQLLMATGAATATARKTYQDRGDYNNNKFVGGGSKGFQAIIYPGATAFSFRGDRDGGGGTAKLT
jgi:hypothetical protein